MAYQVLLSEEFHGMTDAWTEHLCLEILADGRIELSSRSAEPLMAGDWSAGEVEWPEGYDPDSDDGDDDDDGVLPLTVGGKLVAGRDGDFIVGEELQPHHDEVIAAFNPGEINAARVWLKDYGWAEKPGFERAWMTISETLSSSDHRRQSH